MRRDIKDRGDINKIVNLFYEKAKADDIIGFFFSEVVAVNWEKHLPMMCAFWENVLFYTGNYEGDPLTTHRNIHNKYATSLQHFERWIQLFDECVDELYKGANAEKMKFHAKGIAKVMQEQIGKKDGKTEE